MKRKLLQYLICPSCKGEMSLKVFEEERNEIISGLFECLCGKKYPVAGCIPRLYEGSLKENTDFIKKYGGLIGKVDFDLKMSLDEIRTRKTFEYEWLNYNVIVGNEKDIFFEQTQLKPEEIKGRFVIDVGCGMGRYTKLALDSGAEVVGFDIGRSVEKAWSNLKGDSNAHIVQGDIMNLPLKNNTFDIVYSLGVLHHTRDAHSAFEGVSKLAKPGGIATMWVYGRAGAYKDFITNEFKHERRIFKILQKNKILSVIYWLSIKTREFISETSRIFTTRMPHRLLYGFCCILAVAGKIPLLKYLTYSVLPGFKARVMENFDWLSPRYQSHHTAGEVRQWFETAGFRDIKILTQGLVPVAGARAVKKD